MQGGSSSNILREFLVRVRYAVDKDTLRSFETGLKNATRSVSLAAKEMTASLLGAGGLLEAINVVTKHWEDMYYRAQDARATVRHVAQISYAFRQVGISADQAQGTIAAIGQSLSTLRGQIVFPTAARLFGFKTTDDPAQVLRKLVETYHTILQTGNKTREGMFRTFLQSYMPQVDPEMLRRAALPQNFKVFEEGYARPAKIAADLGLNLGELAKNSRDFQNSLRDWWLEISSVADDIVGKLTGPLDKALKGLNQYLKNHMTDIGTWIDKNIVPAIDRMSDEKNWEGAIKQAKALATTLAGIADSVKQVGEALAWLAQHPAIAAYVTTLVATKSPTAAMAAAVYFGTPSEKQFAEGLQRQHAFERYLKTLTWGQSTHYLLHPLGAERQNFDKLFDKYLKADPKEKRVLELQDKWLSGQTHSPNVEIYEARGIWSRMRDWLMGGTTVRPKVDANIDYTPLYQALGITPAGTPSGVGSAGAGAGRAGGFTYNGPMKSGPISANQLARYKQYYAYLLNQEHLTPEQAAGMLGNMQAESQGNPAAIGDAGTSGGLFQWHAGRMARMTRALGQEWRRNWQGQLHYAVQEMRQIDPGYFGAGGTPQSKTAEWTRRFEVPANTGLQAAIRAAGVGHLLGRMSTSLVTPPPAGIAPLSASGRGSVNVGGVNNHFHIYGGNGPEVGSYVFGAQSRAHSNLLRNLTPLTQ